MNGKYAFSIALPQTESSACLAALQSAATAILPEAKRLGLVSLRLYSETVEGNPYAFLFYAAQNDAAGERVLEAVRRNAPSLWEGWRQARHVYEFKLHPGDSYDGLKTQGIIIGVKAGTLDEYVRLHDEQPQMIHDLCYQNGFRKSSIFVAELHKPYLLQFQEFSGQENPELYQNPTYQHWLAVTGECQEPLPGETFWKPMHTVLDI